MKLLLIIIGIIVCLIIIVIIIGYLLPVKHKSSVQVLIDAAPEKVWQRLINFKDYPEWRMDLKNVEVKSNTEWVETNSNNDKLPLKILTNKPLQTLITQFNATDLPYGGSWEFNLTPEGDNTMVSITENGEVYNPIFRFVSKFIMGHATSQKKYADYLKQSFQ